MASDAKISRSKGSKARWLQPHRERFLEGLAAQGYARCSLRNYDRAIGLLCAAAEKRGLGAGDRRAQDATARPARRKPDDRAPHGAPSAHLLVLVGASIGRALLLLSGMAALWRRARKRSRVAAAKAQPLAPPPAGHPLNASSTLPRWCLPEPPDHPHREIDGKNSRQVASYLCASRKVLDGSEHDGRRDDDWRGARMWCHEIRATSLYSVGQRPEP